MLESILQTLRDVEGVQAAMIVDHGGAVLAHHAHAIYDLSILQAVARAATQAIDSIQLVQDDWDVFTAKFADGKLVLRSVRVAGARPRRYTLAVVGDASLNVVFLGVALRVAAAKLIPVLEAAREPFPVTAVGSDPGLARGALPESVARAQPPTGAPWSSPGSAPRTLATAPVPVSRGGSDVSATDPQSATFLAACTRALAANIGPLAKVLVREAVRKVCGDRPFSRADAPLLLMHLASSIDDPAARATFQRATSAL